MENQAQEWWRRKLMHEERASLQRPMSVQRVGVPFASPRTSQFALSRAHGAAFMYSQCSGYFDSSLMSGARLK